MNNMPDGRLVVAISSRALFDFEEENRVFEAGDDRAYMQLQLQRLDQPALPGTSFPLVRKLLAFNAGAAEPLVDVVILSRNDPVSGLRVFRSARHYELPVQRGVFTRGADPWRYLRPLRANLFLSMNEADVRSAIDAAVPAARVFPFTAPTVDNHPNEVRIAFDGDAVLFSDEAERVFQRDGLDAFQLHEHTRAALPLGAGPFKPFLEALHRLQSRRAQGMRIRTALVTARSAPAHERAIRTLMEWQIEIDEAMFLGGLPKGEFLREFEPDFFFDDQTGHIENALVHVPAGHVVSGVVNVLPVAAPEYGSDMAQPEPPPEPDLPDDTALQSSVSCFQPISQLVSQLMSQPGFEPPATPLFEPTPYMPAAPMHSADNAPGTSYAAASPWSDFGAESMDGGMPVLEEVSAPQSWLTEEAPAWAPVAMEAPSWAPVAVEAPVAEMPQASDEEEDDDEEDDENDDGADTEAAGTADTDASTVRKVMGLPGWSPDRDHQRKRFGKRRQLRPKAAI